MTGRKINRKAPQVSDGQVLAAIKAGLYRVCLATGQVTSAATGKPLTPFYHYTNDPNHLHPYLRVRVNGVRRGISVCRLVWLASRGRVPPKGCDIHHLDGDPQNNHHQNLVCIHWLDHELVHQLLAQGTIPF